MQRWDVWAPLAAVALLVAALGLPRSTPLALPCAVALVGAVLAAVHHAEVVAHRLGEPLGTLVLALAVTVIETALILSMMLAGGADKAEPAAPCSCSCRRPGPRSAPRAQIGCRRASTSPWVRRSRASG
jgi:hypothetical protein